MSEAVHNEQGSAPFRVEVFYDFVCPYSYIGQHEMKQLAAEYGVEPVWRPHWLHPETPPEGSAVPADPERRGATLAWLKEMSPEMTAEIRMPQKTDYSFLAFVGMEYARDRGVANAFLEQVFAARWTRGEDIGRVETLMAAGERAGLDPADVGRALLNPEYIQRALDAVVAARQYGITNTPTTILGRTAIVGWHYYEVIQSVMEKQGVMPRTPSVS